MGCARPSRAPKLNFGGNNVDVVSTGGSTSLPLQFPETGLEAASTVIDFSQGAVTASTENTHLAIQGEGFFGLVDPGSVNAVGAISYTGTTHLHLTRDGEFHTSANGLLENDAGYYLVTAGITAGFWNAGQIHTVYNNMDTTANGAGLTSVVRLTDFVADTMPVGTIAADGVTVIGTATASLVKVTLGKQTLQYTPLGSTIFNAGYHFGVLDHFATITQQQATTSDATILTKSLESSNSSMTQEVPELSLAQKLFSALTKVLQTNQTDTDSVINLIR